MILSSHHRAELVPSPIPHPSGRYLSPASTKSIDDILQNCSIQPDGEHRDPIMLFSDHRWKPAKYNSSSSTDSSTDQSCESSTISSREDLADFSALTVLKSLSLNDPLPSPTPPAYKPQVEPPQPRYNRYNLESSSHHRPTQPPPNMFPPSPHVPQQKQHRPREEPPARLTSNSGNSGSGGNRELVSCVWCGELQGRSTKSPIVYSPKVFLGGVPWDITEPALLSSFRNFGVMKVEWPGKDKRHTRHPPKGFVYLLFDSEAGVHRLVQSCRKDASGMYYYSLTTRRVHGIEKVQVQVIPWNLADSNRGPHNLVNGIDTNKTVFVGGLHGLLVADDLGRIMNDLFGGVVYAGIDIDRNKYPIGSGRVTFGNWQSYMKAIMAGFVEIRTSKFSKKVQIDPYLEDKQCSQCGVHSGPLFCRDQNCFKYYCEQCWQWQHSVGWLRNHRPISRSQKKTFTS